MARGRKSPVLRFLAPAERAELAHWQRATTMRAGRARRAQLIWWRADGLPRSEMARRLGLGRRMVRTWLRRFSNKRTAGRADQCGRGRQPVFAPTVAVPLVKLACERPDRLGRALSQGDCTERARQLSAEGGVEHRSPGTVRRILAHHTLTPWRHHRWLSPHTPRLRADDMGLCVAEKTSWPPRPRRHATRPTPPAAAYAGRARAPAGRRRASLGGLGYAHRPGLWAVLRA